MPEQKLPIGIQDFEALRKGNFLYIDKTEIIYQLITQGRVYFLSRPRRFGKSLLLSTLASAFLGKRELFKDLWIEKSDYKWEIHPVIRLDMSTIPNHSPEELEKYLLRQLVKIAKYYNCELDTSVKASIALSELMSSLAQLNKVVVLIDEYDKPILDQIHNMDVAKQNRELLKNFYGILKSQDHNLRFVFLTGVTKFSKVSVFSGLNNLNDITLTGKYATLLGYTQVELERYFQTRITQLADHLNQPTEKTLSEIKRWYNGYRFSEVEAYVYNPFSTLLLFDQQKFTTHWFATGTPSFLIKLIEQQNFDLKMAANSRVKETSFANYDIEQLECFPLLYQTGYLTIKDYRPDRMTYRLDFPNYEVESAFIEELLRYTVRFPKETQQHYLDQLLDTLEQNDFDALFAILNQFFAQIPYELFAKGERFYQTVFYLLFTLLGVQADAEVHTSLGRIDTVMDLPDKVLIFEFKIDKSAKEALKQIKERDYGAKYQGSGKTIYAIGVNFNTEKRNIDNWVVKILS